MIIHDVMLKIPLFLEDNMKLKILIIEDEPLIRNELKALLQSNGYEIAALENFTNVVDWIKDEQPHLILLDIKLPGTNGFSLCTQIRTFSDVPIIFVTSCTTDMDELNQLYVDDNTLSVNINRIRNKLESIGLKDFIKTKHRQGYTL